MGDIADQAGDLIDNTEAAHIARIRKAAADIPKGVPGICMACEEESLRLVNSECARCRDMHR